ncbi:MAG: ChaN family lipoprotein [gamma proteobacterium symbiont of Taylorina sp.]|nr:ChaN family lipoprotein [gamma proteobacterium symbiont of Taylorina sp.]
MKNDDTNSNSKPENYYFLVIIGLIYLISGCQIQSVDQITYTENTRNHPLVNKIWSVSEQQTISTDILNKKISLFDVILLGETHDNSKHHQLQAQIIDQLVQQQQKPAIAFEMLDQNQQQTISQFQEKSAVKTDEFAKIVAWEKTGWPEWRYYRPVFDSAIHNKLTIIAANLNSKQVRKVIKQGTKVLNTQYQAMHKKYQYDVELKRELEQEIQAAHCDMLPEKMLSPMLAGQQTRDIAMTLAIQKQLSSPDNEGLVLIAGAGHTRTDYGIPYYLQKEMPDKKIISIAFIEVSADKFKPAEYAENWNTRSKKFPFDYVWFTSRAEREDQCEKMRAYMKKNARK